jgi:transcriptional regulator with XRE-family HTH domain
LDAEEPEPAPAPVAEPEPQPAEDHGLQVAAAIRALRQRGGLSQRQLALRMRVPRTYVSKIENEKATPTLSSLQRLATALQVTVPDLLRGGARTHEDTVRELLADQFVAELIPYVGKLNGMQWTSVLSQVRDLTVHPRRSA